MNLGFNEGKRERRGGWEKGKEKGPPSRVGLKLLPFAGGNPRAEYGCPRGPRAQAPRYCPTPTTLRPSSVPGSSNPERGPVAVGNPNRPHSRVA